MKNLEQDKKTISNSTTEINRAAKYKGVKPLTIHIAKAVLGTNNRNEVYQFIDENRDVEIYIKLC